MRDYSKLLPNIMMISNIRENGETTGALPDGEMHFHHDQIHAEIPHNGTLLCSVEVPTYGGDTLFASGYAAYDTLDPAIKTKHVAIESEPIPRQDAAPEPNHSAFHGRPGRRCPPVRRSGSSLSGKIAGCGFAPRFFQTQPRGDALALQ